MARLTSSSTLRSRNLRPGDEIMFNITSIAGAHLGIASEILVGTVQDESESYLNFPGPNTRIFRALGYDGTAMDDTQHRYKLARAVWGLGPEVGVNGFWPQQWNVLPAQSIHNIWSLSLALLEHLELIRDLRSYYNPNGVSLGL